MEHLFNLLQNGKTQFHVVDYCKNFFIENNFISLDIKDDWGTLTPGKYIVSPYSSMLIAFVIGKEASQLRISMCHTDFPMLKLKSNPDISTQGYLQANVEPYGGIIAGTWFDRPLGLAGKLVLKGDNPFNPTTLLYDSKEPLFIIPNLAPHLKKDKTTDLDFQKELIPIIGMSDQDTSDKTQILINYIAKENNIKPENILDYDLYLYATGEPCYLGLNKEFITSPRIDNLSSVSAISEALVKANINSSYAVGVFYDNEEIGSRSKQGADSLLVREIIERIIPDKKSIYGGFNISLDVAHGLHPNYMEKSDITNKTPLGKGVVLKTSASQRYVTDSEAGATIISLCKEKDIKLQRQVNRSGMPGGQTLGPIAASYLPMKSVDMGIPVLAMHSARETIHKNDYLELKKLVTEYYQY